MTKVLVLVFALNLVIERIAQLSQAIGVAGANDWQAMLQLSLRLPHFWTGLLVPVAYLAALWTAARLLAAFEVSQTWDETVIKALQDLGANLMYAGIAALFFVPTLESWINLGGRGLKVDFDVNPVAIGMIGMVLKLIARRFLEQAQHSAANQTEP